MDNLQNLVVPKNKDNEAVLSFVFGIINVTTWFYFFDSTSISIVRFVLAIIGLILGIIGLKSTQRKLAIGGIALSILSLFASLFFVLIYFLFFLCSMSPSCNPFPNFT